MINKTIHYCWFGRNEKPKKFYRCIQSWKKYCPDYEIIEWNEDNFDISSSPLYVIQAYESGKWAFVSDFVRLWAVYTYGGVYFDTDVELCKPIDIFLNYKAFFGMQSDLKVATGLGFGSEAGTELLNSLIQEYYIISFILNDGSFDLLDCPSRNARVFQQYGLVQENRTQILQDNTCILSTEYLNPIDWKTGIKHKTRNTYAIHWYAASWFDENMRLSATRIRRKERIRYYYTKLKKIFG